MLTVGRKSASTGQLARANGSVSREELDSHVILAELNGSRENAQQFGPAALCVAGGGQFAPQHFAAAPSVHLRFASA